MMKITVKKLKGSFEIEAEPHHTVADLKKKIETAEVPHKYPAERQMLIHGGKVLKDETTLQENQVNENGFVVVLLSPINRSCGETSTAAAAAPVAEIISCTPAPPHPSPEEPSTISAAVPSVSVQPTQPGGGMPNAIPLNLFPQDVAPVPETSCTPAPPSPEDSSTAAATTTTTTAAVPSPTQISVQPTQEAPAGGGGMPNTNPSNLFPQDLADSNLDILRNGQQFRDFGTIVHTQPQRLQYICLEELRKHNPMIYRSIRESQADFDVLINEGRGDRVGDSNLTIAEMMAIFRLERLGFDRLFVTQVFLACGKNEQVARRYLLDQMQYE